MNCIPTCFITLTIKNAVMALISNDSIHDSSSDHPDHY